MANLIKFDYAIKKLLRHKACFSILEGFLSELLKQDIKIEEILESESNKETKEDKSNRVDLLVKSGESERIIIEIQCDYQWDYLSRILYGTSKVVTETIKQGEEYKIIKKVISVNIVYFDLGQGEDYVYRGTTTFEGLHKHDKLKLNLKEQSLYNGKQEVSEIYPEYYIIKVNKFNEVAKDSFDEWVYFLKTENIKDNFKAKGLKEAKEQLDILRMNEKERKQYDRYLENMMLEKSLLNSYYISGQVDGVKEGIEKGIERGREEEKIEIAKKLVAVDMSIDEIIKITGLKLEQIKK